MTNRPKIYMDACCFIDLVKHELKVLGAERQGDVWHLRKLLEAHLAQEIEVYTSVLSIAECIYAGETPDESVPERFNRLLTSGQYVVLVQPTPFLALDARALYWNHGIRMRGADALHVASALDRGCAEFLTTDGKVLDAAEPLQKLGIRVIRAAQSALLPDHYRQLDVEGLD